MMKKLTYMLAAMIFLATTSVAADFPSYYPKNGFQRVGVLDDVQLDRSFHEFIQRSDFATSNRLKNRL